MYKKTSPRLFGGWQGHGKRLLLAGLFALLAMGLTGCNEIIGASPNTKTIVEMQPGETKLFKVYGPTQTSVTKCVWYVSGKNGAVLEGPNEFLYELDPEGVQNNRVVVRCKVYAYELHLECFDMCQWEIGWHMTDDTDWEVRVRHDTAPIWQGQYYIRDKTDVQLLKGYTDVTGDLLIGNSLSLPDISPDTGYIGSTIVDYITSLEDLNTLHTIGGNLKVKGNPHLTSLTGLQNLSEVGEDISISENPVLARLATLENIIKVQGNLDIEFNAALTSLVGLGNITAVKGFLVIRDNDSLTNLSGLEKITSVGGNLMIDGNSTLTSLAGLQNLFTIGESLFISQNQSLTSLGLNNLSSVAGYFFQIHDNQALCTYLAEELRDQVLTSGGIGGNIYIFDNKDCATP